MAAGLPTDTALLRKLVNEGKGSILDWAIANGNIQDWSELVVGGIADMGIAPTQTDKVLWQLAGVSTIEYMYPMMMPEVMQLSSDNTADGGEVEIIGLDFNWVKVTQTATLNGTGAVVLTLPLNRVLDLIADETILGNIYLSWAGAVLSSGRPAPPDIREYAQARYSKKTTAVYTVPADTIGVLTKVWGGGLRFNGSGYNTIFQLSKRELAASGVTLKTAPYWTPIKYFGTRDGWYNETFIEIVPALTDLRVTGDSNVTSASSRYSGGFQLILIPV